MLFVHAVESNLSAVVPFTLLEPPAGAIWLYIQNNTTPLFSLFSLCTWVQCVATQHVACGSFLHFLSLFLPQYTCFLSVAVIIIV